MSDNASACTLSTGVRPLGGLRWQACAFWKGLLVLNSISGSADVRLQRGSVVGGRSVERVGGLFFCSGGESWRVTFGERGAKSAVLVPERPAWHLHEASFLLLCFPMQVPGKLLFFPKLETATSDGMGQCDNSQNHLFKRNKTIFNTNRKCMHYALYVDFRNRALQVSKI